MQDYHFQVTEMEGRESPAQKWMGLNLNSDMTGFVALRLWVASLCEGCIWSLTGFGGGALLLYHLLGRSGGIADHRRPESPKLSCWACHLVLPSNPWLA